MNEIKDKILKISELIEKLQKIKDEEGDLEILGYSDEFGEVAEITSTPWFLKTIKKEYVPRYGSEDYEKGHYRFVDYPVRRKELFKKLGDKFLLI